MQDEMFYFYIRFMSECRRENHGVRSEKKHFFMKNAKDYDFLFSNVLTF